MLQQLLASQSYKKVMCREEALSSFRFFTTHLQCKLYSRIDLKSNVLIVWFLFQLQPITRNQVITEELQWIISWILGHSPIQSGTESIRVTHHSTIQEAYQYYVEKTIQKQFFVHSQSFLK